MSWPEVIPDCMYCSTGTTILTLLFVKIYFYRSFDFTHCHLFLGVMAENPNIESTLHHHELLNNQLTSVDSGLRFGFA
ncbi:hypothetical protein B0O99DRAFT_628398 [Bisporella sp. PMI_857]|nr:hypothetical protein B0O99DRAFT_628398 [Bisporella sp. PMI_857]